MQTTVRWLRCGCCELVQVRTTASQAQSCPLQCTVTSTLPSYAVAEASVATDNVQLPVTGRLSERSCASRAVISCIYFATVNNIRMRVITTSSDEVSKYQRQVSVLPVTWAAHRRLIGKLLVFYSDFKSRWDRCRVISRQSQQNRNPKGKKRRRRNRSICTELSLSQSINQAFIADSKAHKTHTQKKKGICARARTHTHTHTN